jgi:hypothetical protein
MLTIAATALAVVIFAIAAIILVNEWSQLVDHIPA